MMMIPKGRHPAILYVYHYTRWQRAFMLGDWNLDFDIEAQCGKLETV